MCLANPEAAPISSFTAILAIITSVGAGHRRHSVARPSRQVAAAVPFPGAMRLKNRRERPIY